MTGAGKQDQNGDRRTASPLIKKKKSVRTEPKAKILTHLADGSVNVRVRANIADEIKAIAKAKQKSLRGNLNVMERRPSPAAPAPTTSTATSSTSRATRAFLSGDGASATSTITERKTQSLLKCIPDPVLRQEFKTCLNKLKMKKTVPAPNLIEKVAMETDNPSAKRKQLPGTDGSESESRDSSVDPGTSTNDDGFRAPRKRCRKPKRSPPPTTPTSNKFESLRRTTEDPQPPPKKTRPPPIILPGQLDDQKSVHKLVKNFTNDYHVVYYRNSCEIYIHDIDVYQTVFGLMKAEEAHCFSHPTKSDRRHAFVLRGLDIDPPTDEIKDELIAAGVECTGVSKMRGTQRPLFLIITSPKHTDRDLNVHNKFLMCCRVSWERHINKKVIVQCHRCQQWRHGQSYCSMPYRCVKCAGNHASHTCEKPREEPAKCANCGGEHPASSVDCPVYQRILAARERQRAPPAREQRQQRFMPAPTPARNAWQVPRAPAASALPTAGRVPQARVANQTARDESYSQRQPERDQRQPPELSSRNFPALPNRSADGSRAADRGAATESHSAVNGAACTTGETDAGGLFSSLARLNTLINVNAFRRAVDDLCELLVDCRSDQDKFMTVMTFASSVGKYGLSSF